EVLQEGFIPFSLSSNDYSAEFYCHVDVYLYDNQELVGLPYNELVDGDTYYCVAFNAPLQQEQEATPTPIPSPTDTPNGGGGGGGPSGCDCVQDRVCRSCCEYDPDCTYPASPQGSGPEEYIEFSAGGSEGPGVPEFNVYAPDSAFIGNDISGYAADKGTGNRLPGVFIKIYLNGVLVNSVLTDGNGAFSFPATQTGLLTYEASKSGWIQYNQPETNVFDKQKSQAVLAGEETQGSGQPPGLLTGFASAAAGNWWIGLLLLLIAGGFVGYQYYAGQKK
ncbi:MAG: carboxypeptidase-like regulatory domain-containing protein, partial [Candidatus Micrarchaeota archaeon]